MDLKRVKELRLIAAGLYDNLLDNMGTHQCGYISGGVEETIVLAELAKKINADIANWVEQDHLTD